MKYDETMLRKNWWLLKYWRFFYICVACGFVAGIGGIVIGIFDDDFNVVWSSCLVILVAFGTVFYLRDLGKACKKLEQNKGGDDRSETEKL